MRNQRRSLRRGFYTPVGTLPGQSIAGQRAASLPGLPPGAIGRDRWGTCQGWETVGGGFKGLDKSQQAWYETPGSTLMKIVKALLLASCVLGFSLLGNFLANSSVLAQEPIKKDGEIAGGKSHSIPIELQVGQMVEGEFIAVRGQRLRLSLADFTGKSIYIFGETSTRGGFYYAAETNGRLYIVVTNPDGFSVGTRGYNIIYQIKPTNLAPGAGSGKKVTKDVTQPSVTMTTVWVIVRDCRILWLGLDACQGWPWRSKDSNCSP